MSHHLSNIVLAGDLTEKCNKWILLYVLLAEHRNDPIIIVNGPSPQTEMIKIVFGCKKKLMIYYYLYINNNTGK